MFTLSLRDAIPISTGTNVCVAGQMVLQLDGSAGQQLFICNASLDGWNAVNDDAATMASDHTYTDQQVAAEATARQTADSTEAAARARSEEHTPELESRQYIGSRAAQGVLTSNLSNEVT